MRRCWPAAWPCWPTSSAPGPARVHATSVWGASVGLGIAAGACSRPPSTSGSGWRETYAVVGVLGLRAAARPALRRIARVRGRRAAPDRRTRAGPAGRGDDAARLRADPGPQRRRRRRRSCWRLLAAVASSAFAVVERRVRAPAARSRSCCGSRGSGPRPSARSSWARASSACRRSSRPSRSSASAPSLWTASLLVLAWSGTSVATSYLSARCRTRWRARARSPRCSSSSPSVSCPATGSDASSSPWRLVLADGRRRARHRDAQRRCSGREAVASVPPDRAAMGSGANKTARYLGAACGITLFVTVATRREGERTPRA